MTQVPTAACQLLISLGFVFWCVIYDSLFCYISGFTNYRFLSSGFWNWSQWKEIRLARYSKVSTIYIFFSKWTELFFFFWANFGGLKDWVQERLFRSSWRAFDNHLWHQSCFRESAYLLVNSKEATGFWIGELLELKRTTYIIIIWCKEMK